MHLQALSLRGFRLYQEMEFAFAPGINFIHGDNARGKSSLLEAIHFLISGHSFRTSQSKDLITHHLSAFFLKTQFVKHGIGQHITVNVSEKERRVLHNTTQTSSLSSLLGILQGVIIHPEDLALIKGAPNLRRHFLDLQIAQVNPLYVHYLTRYGRAMRQRNYLLRLKNCATIESWEFEMAKAASFLILQRRSAVEDLQHEAGKLYPLLSGETGNFSLQYRTNAPESVDQGVLQQYYLEQLHKHRRRETELGITLTGPHKDDLKICLNEKEVRYFASEGQQRSCIAALRLAEWQRLKLMVEEDPIMLLDDIGIGLDSSRKRRLFEYLSSLGQVFITSTSLEDHIKGDRAFVISL